MIRQPVQAPETQLTLGRRRVVLTRRDPELWRVRFEDQSGEVLDARVVLTELEGYTLVALPDYLDLPVLIRFEEPLKVPVDTRTTLYTLLPVQYEIFVEKGNHRILLGSLSPLDLQTSWEGPPTEGELAYYFLAPVFRTLTADRIPAGTVALPLELYNASGTEQVLDHLMVDSYQLSLYEREGLLVAEVVEVHMVRDGGIEIRYTDRAPDKKAREIRRGLENVRKRGLARVASRTLKSLIFRELI